MVKWIGEQLSKVISNSEKTWKIKLNQTFLKIQKSKYQTVVLMRIELNSEFILKDRRILFEIKVNFLIFALDNFKFLLKGFEHYWRFRFQMPYRIWILEILLKILLKNGINLLINKKEFEHNLYFIFFQ